jgi:CBS domain-containing protein
VDAIAFLRRHPPFDALPDERFERVVAATREASFPAGTVILQQKGLPAEALYVVFEGSVEVLSEGQLLDLIGEGEVFGQVSVMTQEGPFVTIRAHEDTTCLLVEREAAVDAFGTPAGAAFLTATLRRRMGTLEAGLRAPGPAAAGAKVGSLMRGPPVVLEPEVTIREAAARMPRDGAILVHAPGGYGIVTDRDLRTRVLAVGRDPGASLSEVMTAPAFAIGAETLAAEAIVQMVERGFHHAPVTDRSGTAIGLVTETDLIGFGRGSPFEIRSAIERASVIQAAVDAAKRIPEAVAILVEQRLDPSSVGRIISVTTDALTRRLIELAMAEAGSAPVPWGWIAFGSLARHEQALHTDQDHGIAYEAAESLAGELDPYFAHIAWIVTQALEDSGMPRCTANITAEHRGLRRTLDGWVLAFEAWIRNPARAGVGAGAIMFDVRRVAGNLEIEGPIAEVMRASRSVPGFLHRLARNATEHRPPTGFFRDFVVEAGGEHAGRLDLKHGGIMPVTDLARLHAASAGITVNRTLDRLRAAAEAGRIDEESRSELEEVFELLWQLRLEHQAACVRAGAAADDFVNPKELPAVTRHALKEAFRVIDRAQRAVLADLQDLP